MATIDTQKIVDVLTSAKASLGIAEAEWDAFIADLPARLVRAPDDRKEASKLAVEVAKMLLTIAVGVLVATGTFVQFAYTRGVPWKSPTMYLFAGTAALLVISMIAGFTAISGIYKHADGRDGKASEAAWGTGRVKVRLNVQAWSGAFGLAALILSLIVWADKKPVTNSPSVSVTLAGAGPAGSVRVMSLEGEWTSLKLKTEAGQQIILPPQKRAVELRCDGNESGS